jgi:hypothetical protein
MKVKTDEKTGIFILNYAAWQTDRLSFSTESVPGFVRRLRIFGQRDKLKADRSKGA